MVENRKIDGENAKDDFAADGLRPPLTKVVRKI